MTGEKILNQGKNHYAKTVLKKKAGVTVSTGGGEPIPEGEKMTTQDRDPAQPRTDDGKFGTKASAGMVRKYPDHAWRGTYAKGSDMDNAKNEATRKAIWLKNHKTDVDQAKDVRKHYAQKFAQKMKAGTKVAVNEKVFVVAIDMDVNDFIDMLRTYSDKGEGSFPGDKAMVLKKGARTDAEKAALAKSAGTQHGNIEVVTGKGGGAEIAYLKTPYMESSVKNAVAAYKAEKKAGNPGYDYSQTIQKVKLDPNSDKYKKNAAYNEAKKAQPAPTPTPAPAPQEQPQATKKTFDYHEAEKDVGGFYAKNKDFFDKKVAAFNQSHGKNWDAQRYIKAWINQKKSQG